MTRPRTLAVLFFLGLQLSAVLPAIAAEPVSLAGQWRFALDPKDQGTDHRWFTTDLPNRIQLPGALQSQGYGDDVSVDTRWTANLNDRSWFTSPKYEKYRQPGNIKIPFWLQPDKHYVGAAWYQRDVDIPADWSGKRVVLSLERPHWQTTLWLDDKQIGSNDSLSTAHQYDLGAAVPPGRHRITLRTDNRLIVDVGIWAHSVSDHTQGNWNGIVGQITLSATPPVWLDDIQIFPDFQRNCALVKVRIGNDTATPGDGVITVGSQTATVHWDAHGGANKLTIPLDPQAKPWDEFTPELQRLIVQLTAPQIHDERTVSFGLRQIATRDRTLLLNGHEIFLRGTLECCIFPKTGYPPTDVESWKRIIRICKDYGLNHIRFHSWCPPEAAFVAADESGFYYQVEIAAWTHVGQERPIDSWLYREADRILKSYGNHPSFLLMPYGNEPAGAAERDRYLSHWVDHWKATDPRRLYTSASGWPILPENQYDVIPAPRGPAGWLGKDYSRQISKIHVPVVVHEMGQWCAYPDFDFIAKCTGPLKARNFEIFRDSLAGHGMLDQARDFLAASGKLQVLCYKEEIEAALRTPGIAGFQLLDLHDFPGQGTALVGVLDSFWDSKGYVTPQEFRAFCNTTVPLARLTKRVWTTDESLEFDTDVAHFGPTPIQKAVPAWELTDSAGRVVAAGQWPALSISIGRGTRLGRVTTELFGLRAPAAYRLVVELKGTGVRNEWPLWVYAPNDPPPAGDTLIATSLDQRVLDRLSAGGKVLLLPLGRLSPDNPMGSFTPVFWNRQWFPTQQCQALGLLCDPKHPALAEFPTDSSANWQWQDPVDYSRAMVLDGMPKELRPIVQVIDDWNTNRRLGMLFECRVGRGRLLVCSADLSTDLHHRPAARQLLESLVHYTHGDAFEPKVVVTPARLQALMRAAASPSDPN